MLDIVVSIKDIGEIKIDVVFGFIEFVNCNFFFLKFCREFYINILFGREIRMIVFR